jgi:hypothetical protein
VAVDNSSVKVIVKQKAEGVILCVMNFGADYPDFRTKQVNRYGYPMGHVMIREVYIKWAGITAWRSLGTIYESILLSWCSNDSSAMTTAITPRQ